MKRILVVISVGILASATLSPASGQARGMRTAPAANRLPAAQMVGDLFRAGCELCDEYQYGLAVWALQRAATLAPREPSIRLSLAHALCQSGASLEGEAALQQVLAVISSPEGSHDERGSAEHEAGEHESAERPGGEHATAQAPVYRACALNYLGVMYALRGEKTEAASHFEEAAALETEIQDIARANQVVLDGGAPFTWSVETDAPARDRSGGPRVVKVKLVDVGDALAEATKCLKNGDPNQALNVAQRAAKLDRSIAGKDYYLCLSEAYEAKGWLPEAVTALQTASRAGDAGPDVMTRLQELTQKHPELQLEPRELLTGERLRIRYACPPRMARRVLGQLERVQQGVHQSFGVDLPSVYVRIFSDQESMQRYEMLRSGRPQPEWLAGRARGAPHSPMIMAHAQARPPDLIDNFRHEYAHLVWGALGGKGRLPKWLNEGLADVIEEGPQASTERLRNAYATGRLMGPADLERFWRDPSIKARAENEMAYLCYDQAHSLVTFLLETRGPEMVMDWLLLLRAGHDPEHAFQALTGQTWEQFFTVWAQACFG